MGLGGVRGTEDRRDPCPVPRLVALARTLARRRNDRPGRRARGLRDRQGPWRGRRTAPLFPRTPAAGAGSSVDRPRAGGGRHARAVDGFDLGPWLGTRGTGDR